MAIQDTVTITQIEQIPNNRGDGTYPKFHYTSANGKENTKAIFNKEIAAIMTNAHIGKLPCLISLDKTDDKGESSQYWNIKSAEVVIGTMNEDSKTTGTPATAPQTAEKTVAPPKPANPTGYNSDGAARGMSVKEIGDMIRSDDLIGIFGAEIAKELVRWYRRELLGITRIEHDSKDLPNFD